MTVLEIRFVKSKYGSRNLLAGLLAAIAISALTLVNLVMAATSGAIVRRGGQYAPYRRIRKYDP
jgi:hypothetical protein